MDEIDKMLAEDPNATVVYVDQQVWLLTGDDMKVAREALGKPKPEKKPDESS